MSKVTGCQAGYKAKIIKCESCERAPFLSPPCMEHTYHEVNGVWYPIPFLGLLTDAPIEPIMLPVNKK